MKTRFNKILTVITAVTFAAALTLNIQASLSDPFAGMSDGALTMTTSDEETSGYIEYDCYKRVLGDTGFYHVECKPQCPDKKGNILEVEGKCIIYW